MIPPTSTFDKNNEVYMCCCGSCHITTGAMIVAILEIIRSCATFICGCVVVSQPYGNATILVSSIFYTCLSIIACVSLFMGLKRERASFVVMLMVMQILHIIGLAIGAIIFISILAGAIIISGFRFTAAVLGVALGIQLLFICLDIWFFTIVNRVHRYLKALECHHHMHMPQVQYAAYPSGVMVASGQPVMTVGVQMPYAAGQPYYAQPQYGYPQQQPQFAPQGTANPAPGPYQPYATEKPAAPPEQAGF